MIDQIRSDCDNPYLDEKEFYRVNITDTDTNFFAVVWIDWNNRSIECVYKIGTEGKTIEKPPEGECKSHASYKCDSGNLYWFDSCGNKQDKKEYCQYGCSEKACLGECKSNAEYRCYGDHVFWFDSCGNKQDKKEYCNYGCENGFCRTKPAEKTCEEAGGYCIWPSAAIPPTAASGGGGGGGQATATGMVIATVTTSTSTVVTYQCKDGYELGKYFCKEGGMCCIPKVTVPTEFCGKSTEGPCTSDSDCITGGCSGQVCQSIKEEPIITTCEYRDCYNAENYGMKCKCVKGDSTGTAASAAGYCHWVSSHSITISSPNGGETFSDNQIIPIKTKIVSDKKGSIKIWFIEESLDYVYDVGTVYGVSPSAINYIYTVNLNLPKLKEMGSSTPPAGIKYRAVAEWNSDDAKEKFQDGSDNHFSIVSANQTCTDSDGGKNYYVKGTAQDSQTVATDICGIKDAGYVSNCAGSNCYLWEGYCDNGKASVEIAVPCPNGCSDGACFPQPQNCTNLCYGNIGTYTLGVNESIKIEGYDFSLVTLLTQPPQNELSYWYDGNSGNLGIGDIDLQYYSILGNYFLVNPVFRNQTHAILKIGKCDTTCLDYTCGNYCFENSRFYDGKYISWLPDGKRVMCDDYKNEACPNGCSNGACI
jgi:eight-cysteine-cluster-containing protein